MLFSFVYRSTEWVMVRGQSDDIDRSIEGLTASNMSRINSRILTLQCCDLQCSDKQS
jgi:hypothetical protein